jgi:hypothetical protein
MTLERMPMRRRRLVGSAAFGLAACLVACAAPDFKPLQFAPPVPLQDAPSGEAIVYLLRAPHDSEVLSVFLNGSRVAVLPPESYTAVSLRPGKYALLSAHAKAATAPSAEEPAVLTVAAGERRFLYTAVPTRSSIALGLAPLRAGVVALVSPLRQSTGARYWRECTEQDAQGLLSIAKPVVPERDVL